MCRRALARRFECLVLVCRACLNHRDRRTWRTGSGPSLSRAAPHCSCSAMCESDTWSSMVQPAHPQHKRTHGHTRCHTHTSTRAHTGTHTLARTLALARAGRSPTVRAVVLEAAGCTGQRHPRRLKRRPSVGASMHRCMARRSHAGAGTLTIRAEAGVQVNIVRLEVRCCTAAPDLARRWLLTTVNPQAHTPYPHDPCSHAFAHAHVLSGAGNVPRWPGGLRCDR
jgi:hypothetical protein